ncbi:MAG: hypothetical protein Ct9H300mP8_10020 [Gammaproteobacteria bacterium]|nr:MAG: hypothetical protein Ct9H300mP8_10020 [Gammaproteobacteria bacterium]
MRILITNDDGIQSPGIQDSHVTLRLPDTRSSWSHPITMRRVPEPLWDVFRPTSPYTSPDTRSPDCVPMPMPFRDRRTLRRDRIPRSLRPCPRPRDFRD